MENYKYTYNDIFFDVDVEILPGNVLMNKGTAHFQNYEKNIILATYVENLVAEELEPDEGTKSFMYTMLLEELFKETSD